MRRWFARYAAEGLGGLSDAPRSGAPPKATTGYRERLLGVARCRPRALGLPFSLWTAARLADHLAELTGIRMSAASVCRLLRAGVEKIWGPGRHMAGNNTFSYFLDPHGNTVEYTTELELVDEDTWHPHLYDFTQPEVSDQWGTANQMNEFVAQKSFNDPDKGLFVAPPV